MKRFFLLLANEFKFARTSIPVHIVAILQPTLMYLLMTVILVDPTFSMNVTQPDSKIEHDLALAMQQVGSSIGKPYIDVHFVAADEGQGEFRQLVVIEDRHDQATAVQHYGLIDSNIVKNYRNRLTAAALRLWDADLGDQAIQIEEYAWLPQDVSYKVYFGMALLPMAAAIAASIIGSLLTAQDFERGTILQYRLSPMHPALILGARLTRLIITGMLSAGVLLVAVGAITGFWPATPWKVILVLLPICLITGGLGIVAGLVIQKTIPSFMVALITSFISWIIGSAFGLAAGFGRGYAAASLFTPNTYTVELLFPLYFGAPVGNPLVSMLVLSLMSLLMLGICALVYQFRVISDD